jgi:hypothetical protein
MSTEPMPTDLLLVGGGSLARAVCVGLAGGAGAAITGPRPSTRVLIAARTERAARDISEVAGVIARLSDGAATFHAAALPDWPAFAAPDGAASGGIAPDGADPLVRLIAEAAPRGILVCASYQSPWEALTAPSAWTDLLASAGFGLGLPLQAALALRVARAATTAGTTAWLVNACFPDAVNPLLARAGFPVTVGIGNVALLAAGLQAALALPDQTRLSVLAHHVHLYAPTSEAVEALAWLDGKPVPDVTERLAGLRSTPRPDRNQITGWAGAALLHTMLHGGQIDTSLPGPLGLPGGYPVRVSGDQVSLRLPDDLTETEAVAYNEAAAVRDGVSVTGGRVTFSPAARAALADHLPDLASGFPIADLDAAGRSLLDLRTRLRALPARGAPAAVPTGGH